MIKVVSQLIGMVLAGAIVCGVVSAKELKREVTFIQPVVVNGTLVEKGTYDAVFDDQTNELSIVKGRKVVASAPARLEKREERDRASYLTSENEAGSGGVDLLSIVFKDRNQATIVNSADISQ